MKPKPYNETLDDIAEAIAILEQGRQHLPRMERLVKEVLEHVNYPIPSEKELYFLMGMINIISPGNMVQKERSEFFKRN
jgi:hypothetical protein